MVTDRLILYSEGFFVLCSALQFWMAFREKQPVQTGHTWTACGEKKKSTLGFKTLQFDAMDLYSNILSLSRSIYLVS